MSSDIQKLKDEAKAKLEQLAIEEKELEESDTYKINTNTAYLQNAKITDAFEGYGFFPDWVKIKHEQHWNNLNTGQIEITFKIIKKEKSK